LPGLGARRPARAGRRVGAIALIGAFWLLTTAGCSSGGDSLPTPVLPAATAVVPGDSGATQPLPPVLAAPDVPGGLLRYAIDPLGNTGPDGIAAIVASGSQVVRVHFSWAQLEPQAAAPVPHWAVYDALFTHLQQNGIQVLATVGDCPTWACSDAAGPLDKVAPPVFASFMAAVVAHYSQPPFNIHYWEFFNEPDSTNPPNHGGSWGLHGAQYAALLQATVPQVRTLDPQARVLLGGLAYEWFMDEKPPGPFNRTFLQDVVAAGGAPYFDYLNFHYYPQNPHFPSIADKAAALRQLERGLGLDKPLVCTEVGLTSSSDPRWTAPGWPPNSEAVQGRFLVRAYVEGFAAGLSSIAWFTLRDWRDTNPGYQIFLQTGLVRLDGSLKPAATAYRTLRHEVGRRPVLRRLDAAALGSPGLTGLAFGPAGTEVWVVWSLSDQAQPATLAAGTLTRALDLYGTPLAVTGTSVSVGPDPVYLEVDPPR
ncbi:MAG TPA: cellulase family glycosylhydrolase, partial [Chloroflexia bacterium]|nr:cellulase family glycosylhydrolase [Chloroflexia bacterium]